VIHGALITVAVAGESDRRRHAGALAAQIAGLPAAELQRAQVVVVVAGIAADFAGARGVVDFAARLTDLRTAAANRYSEGEKTITPSAVMVWDVGTWEPLGDAPEMLRKGDLKFVLHGEKLNGEFVMAKMRSRRPGSKGTEWLLIKKRDEFAATEDVTADDRSVRSGRTLEDIAVGRPVRIEGVEDVDPSMEGDAGSITELPARRFDVGKGGGAVDLGLPLAEQIEVGPIQNVNGLGAARSCSPVSCCLTRQIGPPPQI